MLSYREHCEHFKQRFPSGSEPDLLEFCSGMLEVENQAQKSGVIFQMSCGHFRRPPLILGSEKNRLCQVWRVCEIRQTASLEVLGALTRLLSDFSKSEGLQYGCLTEGLTPSFSRGIL